MIRRAVARIVAMTAKYACTTYGDVAELSPGPCARCVGQEVCGAAQSPATPNNSIWKSKILTEYKKEKYK